MASTPCSTLLLALALSLLPSSLACSLAPGACTPSKCSSLMSLTSAVKNVNAQNAFPYFNGVDNTSPDLQLGWWQGVANNNSKALTNNVRGGSFVNWELFPYIGIGPESGFLLSAASTTYMQDCCNLCAQTTGCVIFQFFANGNNLATLYNPAGKQGCTKWPLGFRIGYNCYLLSGGSVNESKKTGTFANGKSILSPWTPTHKEQTNTTWLQYPASYVGGYCNPDSGVTGDPHFMGARGTRFEFNGEMNKSFVLISDQKFQMNVRMDGYLDSRTADAPKVKDGKAVRTWIRDIGLMWIEADGSKHSLVLKARTGLEAAVGDGFMASILVDGVEVEAPAFGGEISDGAMHLKRVGVHKRWVFDVETYHLSLDDLVDVKLELRPSHPLLRTEEDVYVHFALFIRNLKATESVHGILGQTFRATADRAVRALEYQLLSKLMQAPISADSDIGKGFLDGDVGDYEVDNVLSTYFKYSSFGTS